MVALDSVKERVINLDNNGLGSVYVYHNITTLLREDTLIISFLHSNIAYHNFFLLNQILFNHFSDSLVLDLPHSNNNEFLRQALLSRDGQCADFQFDGFSIGFLTFFEISIGFFTFLKNRLDFR